MTTDVMSHGLIRNELWIQRDEEHVRIRVAATLDEIMLADGLHADHDRSVGVDELKSAIDHHAAYLAKHLAMSTPDGVKVEFAPAGLKLTEKLSAQLLPPVPSAESGAAALPLSPEQLSPVTTRVSYEFIAKLPDAAKHQALSLTHKMLSDIPAASSTAPTVLVYVTRMKTGDQPIASSQLRLHDTLTVEPASPSSLANKPSSPVVAAKKRSMPWGLLAVVCGLAVAIGYAIKLRMKIPVAVLFLAMWVGGAVAQPVSKVYLAPDDHTDFIWTDTESNYEGYWTSMLDYYVTQADAHLGNTEQFQSRFTTDGTYWLKTYEKKRTAPQFQHLMERVQSGHISSPMSPLTVAQGMLPAEIALRQLYYAGKLERRWNVRFPLAGAMENQTMPFGVGSLWAGSGAKYIWHGVCFCDTQVPQLGERARHIYRWKGRDGTSLLTKWYNSYGSYSLGGYAEARDPDELFNNILNIPGSNFNTTYAAYRSVVGAFGQGGDDGETLNLNLLNYAQANSTPQQQIIVSNQIDFFKEFEAQFGSGLEEVSLSFGNEWDAYVAALQEVSAGMKRSIEKLRAAEAMTTLVSLKNPSFVAGTEAEREDAFLKFGLFFEHDFVFGRNASLGAERVAFERNILSTVQGYVNSWHSSSATALGTMIAKTGANARFFVFNPLGWVRTDHADFAYTGSLPVHVVDVSNGNAEVPSQIVTVNSNQYLRIWAESIPSVGYKVYEVRSGAGTGFSNTITSTLNTNDAVLENANYKVTVNKRGAITSLIDKTRSNVELAATGSPCLNDLGGSNNGSSIVVENSGPVSITLKSVSTQVLNHTSRITLFRTGDRVDIKNEITQALSDATNATIPSTQRTWKFGINVTSPNVWHEEVGAVINAKRQVDGGHYSNDSARYDWLTFNHFAAMSGTGSKGLTISNADSFVFKLGTSTATSLDSGTPLISALALGRMTSENPIHNQNGDSYFMHRFALRSHGAFNQTEAMKFSLEHQNPLVTSEVTGTFSGATLYPSTTYSLLTISDPDVLLWALKPHEDGIASGVTARTWNMDTSAATTIDFASNITSARSMVHTERALAPATVTAGNLSFTAGEQKMQTHTMLLEGQLTGYDAWKAVNFTAPEQANAAISGPMADPDSDGSENLKEYAFSTAPKTVQIVPVTNGEVTIGGLRYLTVSFPQRTDALDVVYVVQSSTDLVNWSDTAFLVGGEGSGAAFVSSTGLGVQTTVTARDLVPIPQGGQRFLRVQVRR